MFRAYRVIATGQWAGPLLEDAGFPDDGLERADRVAETLGLQPGALEVVDSETDPRTGELLEDPNVPPPPGPPDPNPDEELRRALEAARAGSMGDLIDVLQGINGLAAAKGRLAEGGR
jgi:hypothetical protein